MELHRKNPLWIRSVHRAGETELDLLAGESNLLVSTQEVRALPAGSSFLWYGVSLVPDADLTRETLARVWTTGRVVIRTGKGESLAWIDMPARLLMPHPDMLAVDNADELAKVLGEQADAQTALRRAWLCDPIRDVRVADRPIWLASEEPIRATLTMPSGCYTSVGLLLVFWGVYRTKSAEPVLGTSGDAPADPSDRLCT